LSLIVLGTGVPVRGEPENPEAGLKVVFFRLWRVLYVVSSSTWSSLCAVVVVKNPGRVERGDAANGLFNFGWWK